jgi:pimeloyl-ACP methyl ester carboxylesterase
MISGDNMEKIDVNGIRLAYTRRGTGTPLLLIHGYPLDHTIWDEVLPLLEKDFDLILPDVRGFGESTTIDSQYSMNDIAYDFVALLDHLGIQKAALAGHSMGGYIALAFARLHPERVTGLALVASQALADTSDNKQGRYKTAADVAEKGVGLVAEAMPPKLSADAHVQGFVRELIRKQNKDGIIGALKAMAEREDSLALFPSFNFPVVLIHGSADILLPIECAYEVKKIISSAHLMELSNAGHMPMLEMPERTADALKLLK